MGKYKIDHLMFASLEAKGWVAFQSNGKHGYWPRLCPFSFEYSITLKFIRPKLEKIQSIQNEAIAVEGAVGQSTNRMP